MVTLLGFKVDDSGRGQYNKGIDQTKQKQQSLTASFLKAQMIYGVAQKAMGAAYSFVRDQVFGATVQADKYSASLGVLMGNQEKANALVKEVSNMAIGNIYGDEAVLSGVQGLMQFGIAGDAAMDTITRLGDIANGSGEALASLGLNMGQVFAKGKADATDLKQFVLQGFDVVGIVAQQTGKTREQVEKSGVTYEQTAAALKQLTSEGGKYYGMMDKVSNTLGGIVGQLGALKDSIAMNIGLGVNDELKDLLKYILAMGRASQDSVQNTFIKALKEVIHWIFQVIIMWKVLGYRIADMGDAFAPVKQFFSDLKDAAGDVLTGIMILAVEVGRFIVAAFKPIQAFASPIIKELGAIAKDVFSAIAAVIRPLVPMVENSAGFFGVLGRIVASLLRPALALAVGIKAINTALGAYKAAVGVAKTASFIFSGDLAKMAAGLTKLTGSGKIGKGLADTFGLLTGKLSVMKKAAEGNKVAMAILDAQMLKNKVTTLAHAAATKVAAAATKAWDWMKQVAGVVKSTAALVANKIATVAVTVAQKIAAVAGKAWAAIQMILNAVMAANPIGLIIIAVVALIVIIGLLVKNWDKVKAALIAGAKAVGKFFVKLWEGIKAAALAVFKAIKTIITTYVKIWIAIFTGIAKFFVWLWAHIVDLAKKAWNGLKSFFTAFIAIVKSIFKAIAAFFAQLWEGIVSVAKSIWNGLVNFFSSVIEGWKIIFGALGEFFSGLWDAIMQGPSAAIEYIKNAFFGLFNSIQEKLFGFLNKIKEGWDWVKGFFSGAVDGVVNFFTGGSAGGGGGQMQPAYAGATQAAMAGAVGPTSNYAYNSTGGSSTMNAQTSINVNVPQGTPQEQSEALARQIDAQFNAKLAGSINSSRANIPSPEVRRH